MPRLPSKHSTEKIMDYENVVDDVIVYRITTTTIDSLKTAAEITTIEGITSQAWLLNFMKSETMPPYKSSCFAVFGDTEFREAMRMNGWLDNDVYKRRDALNQKPYTRFVAGEVHAEDLVFIHDASHMIFDKDGLPLPCANQFEYINGCMDNGHYDLAKALTILKARNDIRFGSPDRWTNPGEVHGIPSYNASKTRNAYLHFVWMPSVEDYRRMWAKCVEYGGKYPSVERYRAVFDCDLLGLRAGGAALFDTFYASVEEEPDDD